MPEQSSNGSVSPGPIAKCGWMNMNCTFCALHEQSIELEVCEICEDYERES